MGTSPLMGMGLGGAFPWRGRGPLRARPQQSRAHSALAAHYQGTALGRWKAPGCMRTSISSTRHGPREIGKVGFEREPARLVELKPTHEQALCISSAAIPASLEAAAIHVYSGVLDAEICISTPRRPDPVRIAPLHAYSQACTAPQVQHSQCRPLAKRSAT